MVLNEDSSSIKTQIDNYDVPLFPAAGLGLTSSSLQHVNIDNKLEKVTSGLFHAGFVWAIDYSRDGCLLASADTVGIIKIWETEEYSQIQELRDSKEPHCEEYYVVRFSRDACHMVAAGKLKDRHNWNAEDNDLQVISGPIKIFDTKTGQVLCRIDSHQQEVFCADVVYYDDNPYIVSCGQEGFLCKHKMTKDFKKKLNTTRFQCTSPEGVTLCLAFLPQYDNKVFLALVERELRVFDLVTAKEVHAFDKEIATFLCDSMTLVYPVDMDEKPGEILLLIRCIDMPDEDEQDYANYVKLVRLDCTETDIAKWSLSVLKEYREPSYLGNFWPLKISTNNRYVFAPSHNGKIFVWNIASGHLSAVLEHHDKAPVRAISFCPTKPHVATSSDDFQVVVHRSARDRGVEVAPIKAEVGTTPALVPTVDTPTEAQPAAAE